MKKALVLGGGGFIGNHMINQLIKDGYWVRGVDLQHPEFSQTKAHEFIIGDLADAKFTDSIIDQSFDEVYQFAADMGGAGYIFTGEQDAQIMRNSVCININTLEACRKSKSRKVFYSSSACVYPDHNQLDPDNPNCEESSAYPANPDSEYGWEKLFSERLYLAYQKNYELDVCIARYHNIFGPQGTWTGGREKSPAAICRKIAQASAGNEIEMWGDGKQTRSFLYIADCIEASQRLMRSDWSGPVNIGSTEMVTINELARIVMDIANKPLGINHIPGPLGVRGRNSDNRLIWEKLNWRPSYTLKNGLQETYSWIEQQIHQGKTSTM